MNYIIIILNYIKILLLWNYCGILCSNEIFMVDKAKLYLHMNSGSYFGYSVAPFIGQSKSFCLVGAPRDSVYDFDTDRMIRTGKVYRISFQENICSNVPTTSNDLSEKDNNEKIFNSQWIGGEVAGGSRLQDGLQVACDPRFLHESRRQGSNSNNRNQSLYELQLLATGRCSLYTGSSMKYIRLDACSSTDEGTCLAGFSASVAPNNQGSISVALGLPGSFLTEGNIFLGMYSGREELSRVLLKTSPSDLHDKGYNLGYDIQIGEVWRGKGKSPFSVGSNQVVVTSSPNWKANYYRGIVMVLNMKLDLSQIVYIPDTDGHVGSYFGASLALGDFNGDGIMDILVGAPYYTRRNMTKSGGTKLRVDLGAIYLYYGAVMENGMYGVQGVNEKIVIYGKEERGYFGHSLVQLGDIDGDGADDFAVGCPGCGEAHTGAVYVYLGGSTQPVQKIMPEDIIQKPTKPICGTVSLDEEEPGKIIRPFQKFGWSLGANNNDLDGNNVPDMIIGDWASSQIVLLHTKSIFWFDKPVWILPKESALSWTHQYDSSVPCPVNDCNYYVSFSISVFGKQKSTGNTPLEILVNVDLDSNIIEADKKRLLFAANQKSEFTKQIKLHYSSNNNTLVLFSGYVTPKFGEILVNPWQSIVFKVTLEHVPRTLPSATSSPWLLHPTKGNRTYTSLPKKYFHNPQCGTDNKCMSDIRVFISDWSVGVSKHRTDIYYRENDQDRRVIIGIRNWGENAYDTKLRIIMPSYLGFLGIRGWNCTLSISDDSVNVMADCLFSNPFRGSNEMQKIVLTFNTGTAFKKLYRQIGILKKKKKEIKLNELDRKLKLTVEASCQNTDLNLDNNKASIDYFLRVSGHVNVVPQNLNPIVVDPRNVSSKINPLERLYPDKLGPEYKSIFTISNSGPSPLEDVTITFLVPASLGSEPQETSATNSEFYPTEELYREHILYFLKHIQSQDQRGEQDLQSQLPQVYTTRGIAKGNCQISSIYIDPLHINAVKRKFIHQSRFPRSVPTTESPPITPAAQVKSIPLNQIISCANLTHLTTHHEILGNIHCAPITCRISNLTVNSELKIILTARFWSQTYFHYNLAESILITKAFITINNESYGLPVDSDNLKTTQLSFNHTVIYQGVRHLIIRQIPLWPIIVGALIGLLLLFVIIIIMWRCGFFRRNRQFRAEVIDDSSNGGTALLTTPSNGGGGATYHISSSPYKRNDIYYSNNNSDHL